MNDLISYDPETGEFTWPTGKIAGTTTKTGYRRIKLQGKSYLAHRLAWYLYYGKWPENEIDHINRNPSDNRIENLRDVDSRQNNINRTNFKGGGCFHKKSNKWVSQIRINGVDKYLGIFTTQLEAQEAYQRELNELMVY